MWRAFEKALILNAT